MWVLIATVPDLCIPFTSMLLGFVSISMLFTHSMCLDDVVAEGQPFGKEMLTR